MEAIAFFVWPAVAFAILAVLGLSTLARQSQSAASGPDKYAELDGRLSALEREVSSARDAQAARAAAPTPIRRKAPARPKVAASRS